MKPRSREPEVVQIETKRTDNLGGWIGANISVERRSEVTDQESVSDLPPDEKCLQVCQHPLMPSWDTTVIRL